MEFLPNGSKHVKGLVPSGGAGGADSQGNREPNANWAVKPNVNFNLQPVSSFHAHQATDPSVLDGQNQNYLEAELEGKSDSLGTPVASPAEKDHVVQTKSKIPALAPSTASEGQLNRKGVQRLRSPNLNHTPTLSPKAPANSKMVANTSSVRTTEREKSQGCKESAGFSVPDPHTTVSSEEAAKTINKSLKMNPSQRCERESIRNTHSQTSTLSQKLKDSKPANQTPTPTTQTPKPLAAATTPDEKTESCFSPEGAPARSKLQNQRDGAVLNDNKSHDLSSLSPKPKTTGTTARNPSKSKENINSKDSSHGSSSKTQSKDSLDSKIASVSKTSLGSKDSLDLKTGSGSNCKSGKGSRDGLSKTSLDSSKLRPVLHTSKSAGADLSLPLPLSPRPISAKRSPGSAPKSLGASGPNRQAQRSPGAARGQ